MAKKLKKKRVAKKSQEIIIRVQEPSVVPTEQDLSQPVNAGGKNLTIPKTWIEQDQLMFMLQSTPKEQIYKRPGKGGQTFEYVTGSYITKALNYVFGWNWDFEVVEHGSEKNHIWVLGKLIVRGTKPGQVITKTQFGRVEAKMKRGTSEYLDYGNDLKAATTDALKKCASMLGLASDIYGKMEYVAETGKQPIRQVPQQQIAQTSVLKKGQVLDMDGKPTCLCSNCDEPINEQTAEYSMKMHKKMLCANCQK